MSSELNMCSICLQDMTKETTLPACSHKFCEQCIQRWVEIKVEPQCPLCRGRITEEHEIQLFGQRVSRPAVIHGLIVIHVIHIVSAERPSFMEPIYRYVREEARAQFMEPLYRPPNNTPANELE